MSKGAGSLWPRSGQGQVQVADDLGETVQRVLVAVHQADPGRRPGTRTDQSCLDRRRGEHLEPRDAPRSTSIQRAIGALGGKGFDGGHLVGNRFGGIAENINVVAMRDFVNRSAGGAANSYWQLETEWNRILKADPGADITVDITPHHSGDSVVPDRFTVEYQINGGPVEEEIFRNVK